MRKSIIFLILVFSLICGDTYTSFSGKVIYYGNHILHKWSGESSTITGFIIDDDQGSGFSCDIKIPIASFDSKNGNRDSNMLIYTNAIDFPNIQFISNDIVINQNKAKVKGRLFFGGESKNIVTEVDVLVENDISFSGILIIKLSEFKIVRPTLFFNKIDDEIKITFSITGKKGS